MESKNSDIIKTWDWRIRRIGMTARDFAALVNVLGSSLSAYKSGTQKPRDKQFLNIEGKLRELEKEKGFA